MKFQVFVPILLAAGIDAAPSVAARQVASIPLSLFPNNGCNMGAAPFATINVPTDGVCHIVTARPPNGGQNEGGNILPQNLPALPPGCTLHAYTNEVCTTENGNNTISWDRVDPGDGSSCRSFGTPGKFIKSVKTVGTCA